MVQNNILERFFKPQKRNTEYEKELEEMATPLGFDKDEYINFVNCIKNVSSETRNFIFEYIPDVFNYAISFYFPLSLILYRIGVERPWELLKLKENNTNHFAAITTYSELYDLLQAFDKNVAVKFLENMTSNSSYRSKIIISYQTGNKDDFCRAIEETKEDYTEFLNSLYSVCFMVYIIEPYLSFFKSLGNEDGVDKRLIEDFDVQKSILQVSKQTTGESFDIVAFGKQFLPDMTRLIEEIRSLAKCESRTSTTDEEIAQDIANILNRYNTDNIKEEIYNVITYLTSILCDMYVKLGPGLYPKEASVIDDLVRSSEYFDYFNGVLQEVINNSAQTETEADTDADELIDILGNCFLPDNFFDQKNRKQEETGCIGELRQCIIDAGVKRLCGIINFVAERGYVDNTDDNKKNFAFKITGFCPEYAVNGEEQINWHGHTHIVSFIIKNFYDGGKIWKNAERLICLDHGKKFYHQGELTARDNDKDFKEIFYILYPDFKLN